MCLGICPSEAEPEVLAGGTWPLEAWRGCERQMLTGLEIWDSSWVFEFHALDIFEDYKAKEFYRLSLIWICPVNPHILLRGTAAICTLLVLLNLINE